MKERPIIFSAPMVRAILDGTKTQTRRVVKPQPLPFCGPMPAQLSPAFCPYGQPGARVWVRETWREVVYAPHQWDEHSESDVDYKATPRTDLAWSAARWRPSIHMPRRASRITLEIIGVRVERLQDATRSDCMAEGCPFPNLARKTDPRGWFRGLWESINGPDSWDANPWVWVVEFRRVTQAALAAGGGEMKSTKELNDVIL